MAIVRWDPFRDFGFATANTWMPPVDIFQNGEHELVLKAELPDMTREDIDITVENFALTIKGEKKFAERREGRAVPPRRAALRHVQPFVLAAADRGRRQGGGRVQERRAHRAAAASRGSQAAADQGGRRGLAIRQEGLEGREVQAGRLEGPALAAHPAFPACHSRPRHPVLRLACHHGNRKRIRRAGPSSPNPGRAGRSRFRAVSCS